MINKAIKVLLILILSLAAPAAGKELFVATDGTGSEVVADLDKYDVIIYTSHDKSDWLDVDQYVFGFGYQKYFGSVAFHAGLALVNDKETEYWIEEGKDGKPVMRSRVALDETKIEPIVGASASKQIGKSTFYVDCFSIRGLKVEARYSYRIGETDFTVSYVYAPNMQIGGVRVGIAAPI